MHTQDIIIDRIAMQGCDVYYIYVAQAKCKSVHHRGMNRKLWSTYSGCC